MSGIQVHNYLQNILYGWLIIVLMVSSFTDLYYRRIPNVVTFPTILLAIFTYTIIGGWDGFLFSLVGTVFGFALFLLPYLMGGMGAGDVKLMSGVGAVLGFKQTAVCFLFIAICGGIMALGFMVYRRRLKETLSKIFLSFVYLALHRDASLLKVDKSKNIQEGIPYGVAITGGVLLFFVYLIINNNTLTAFGVV